MKNKLKQITGNLITLAEEGHFDFIFHGCNCFGCMNAGIALEVSQRIPNAYLVDRNTKVGDRSKLGYFSFARKTSNIIPEHSYVVINAYTQYSYGRGKDHFEYEKFRKLLRRFRENSEALKPASFRLGFPMIGAGLAQGNWERIKQIIQEELVEYDRGEDLADFEITVVDFDGSK